MLAKRFIVSVASTALAVAGLTVLLPSAPAQALQGTLPGNTSPAWQTNNTVRAIASANGVVYVGGDFTSVRPPGSPAGSGEVARNRIAAFNASTGALITTFNPNLNGAVRVITTSPDGSILYVGGDFTTAGGVTRNRIAAFTTATGALRPWAPSSNSRISGIAATANTVYVAGSFSNIAGQARQRVAALDATTATNRAGFTTATDNVVYQIALAKDNSKLYLAGAFLSVNGDTSFHAVGAVDATTGANTPFPAKSVIPPFSPGCIVELPTVRTDANTVYFGAEGTGGGCFDGTFAANVNDGSLKWQSQCLGATQAVEVVNGLLYSGSHAHDCAADASFDPDAFPEVGWARGLHRHLLARDTVTGKLSPWYPNTNGGATAGLGPRAMGTDGTQLFVGGEFTTVNGVAQQGFARFSPSGTDAGPARPSTPRAVARDGGKVSVFVQAPLDITDPDLTIRLYRDGGTTPIKTAPARSLFWKQPISAFEDNGLAVGTSHTYAVDAVEANGTLVSPRSPNSGSVTVAANAPVYQKAVTANSPSFFWRLNEPAGPTAADSSDSLEGGIYSGGITYGQAGQVAANSGVTTNGSTGFISSSTKVNTPNAYSVEAWVKTTTTNGGKIIGFGDRQLGFDFNGNPALSSSYDKQIYMRNDGKLVFGVWVGFADTLTSTASYNDGQYHHIVGTQGPSGMALYVDGVRIARNGQSTSQDYAGYWRVGGDNLGGWPNQPNSPFFAGTIDDVAVYPTALARTDVVDHYVASGRAAPPSVVPADAYGASVFNDSPINFWRLDETTGDTAADTSDSGNTGQYVNGVTKGAAGALGAQGTAATFNGSDGNVSSTNGSGGPANYSAELWFKTTTNDGGKLIGFGNNQTGNSGAYDKHVYMLNDGRLRFGVYNGGFDTLDSPAGQNDGNWHHVVATQSGSGMKLFLDDNLVDQNGVSTNQGYSGYWRVGGDNLGAWPDRPNSDYFAGTIDEVAIYGGALSATQVDDHFRASGRSGPDVVDPETAITSPDDGDSVGAGPVTVTATATDAGSVASVDLKVDGTVVDTDTSDPYSFTWTATPGPHTLQTVATDTAGNTGESAEVDVTVTAPDVTDPEVSITSPAEGAEVSGPTAVTATATDNVDVTKVELEVDGTVVDTDNSSPYSLNWNATAVGAHTLRAVAYDAAGNTGESAVVHVTVPAPAALHEESWTGANGAGWPAAWATSVSNGSATIQSNQGRLTYNDVANAYARAQLTAVSARADADLLTSYTPSSTTAGSYFSAYVRGSGGWANGYRPRNGYGVQITANSGTVLLDKNVAGTKTTLQSVSGAQTVSTAKHWLRLRVTGSTIQFRIWLDGNPEPSTWAATVTDTSVTADGQTFLSLNRGSNSVGVKYVALDDLVLK